MRRARKLVGAGIALTAGLALTSGTAAASDPEAALNDCIEVAIEQEDVAAAVDSCVEAYLASLEDTSADTVNTGILGSATDGGQNTAILGRADG